VAEVPVPFAGLLRGLRTEAGLTQEELAEAAGLTSRAISYLERGEVASPRKDTVRLLADALGLAGPDRVRFEAAARGRPVPGTVTAQAGAAATRALPRDVASFTGRQRELAGLADAAASAGGVVSIHAIGGMAGIGKTAFAVHAAHRLAGRFPDGQIFLPLHGHSPGQPPADPADALASLLAVIGVPAAQIPDSLQARTALWRDRAARRQLLLILDDAVSSEQVGPLLPGSGGSLVLVTSRRHLSALDEVAVINLDTLPPGEAAALLARLTGRAGLSPLDPGVAELARLCGFLPLAIGMVARQLRHHPAWTAAGLAADLSAAANRTELMATESLSVAAAFDLSYAGLTGDQQRLFRRLGLHPGTDIDAYAAAALNATAVSAARRGLEDLYDHYLIGEPAAGRYRLHDLIRDHARALAEHLDPDSDRESATERLLDYYAQAAARANALIAGQTRPAPALSSADQPILPVVPALTDPEQALAWIRTERASLLACLDHATRQGQHAQVIALTAGLSGLLRRDGPWTDAIPRHTTAIAVAQSLGDRLRQANALNDLGILRRLTGEYAVAVQVLERALGIYREIGDRLGEANALCDLGTPWRMTGEYAAAAQAQERALGIYREIGDRLGEANVLQGLGATWRMTGEYAAAAQAEERALGIYRELGDRLGEANALNTLGAVRRLTGDFPAAAQVLEQALGICRDLGDRGGEANTLSTLGVVRRLTGDFPAAAQVLEEALGIYGEIGDRGGEVEALNERGTLHRVSGELVLAERCHRQALELARAIDSPSDEAHALAGLGRCALAAGRAAEGETGLRKARAIFQRIGAADATDVAAELDALSGQGPL
jgi:tetratricopeptide (TPR) repeat protein/transcriptional regulator with XRE-family HTH domain